MRQPLLLLTSLLAVQVASQSTTQDGPASLSSSFYSYINSLTRTDTPFSTPTDTNTVTGTTGLASSTTKARGSRATDSSATQSDFSTTSIASQASLQSASDNPSTPTSSDTSNSSQTGSAAAATTSNTPEAYNGSSRDRVIAIAVGSVLGALALGLFILLLIIIFDRRRGRRDAKRKGSLAYASEEAFAARNRPSSNTAPMAAVFNPRQSQPIDQRGNARVPLMSERANLGGPSTSDYRNDYSAPYMPGAVDARRSSGLLPTRSNDSTRADGRFQDGTGLNNHPYDDARRTGPALAAGAGGAALGTAAPASAVSAAPARKPLPDEQDFDSRLSRDYGVYSAFLSEPPTPSARRSLMGGTERLSGTEQAGRFYEPQDQTSTTLRDNPSLANADRGVGAAGSGITTRAQRSSRERGRNLPTDPLLHDEQSEETAMLVPRDSRGERVSAYESLPQDVLTTDLPPHESETANILGPLPFEPATGAASRESRGQSDTRSRSYPIPPSLTIPNPNLKRSRLSRGSKRARFASGDTYHEPVSYDQEQASDNGVSPPGTAQSTTFNPVSRRLSAGTAETEELVSPVSPVSTTRGIGRSVSLSHGRANVLNVPRDRGHSPQRIKRRPVSDTSFRVSPPTSESNSTPGDEPVTTRRRRPLSGLVSAVQDHFSPSQSQPYQSAQIPTYKAYTPSETLRPSVLAPTTNIAATSSTTNPPKPITRKPVPRSRYSGWKPLPQLPTDSSGGATRENWWRDEGEPI